jgi:glyoxylate reductase
MARVLITRRWPKAAEDAAKARFDVTVNADDAPMDSAALADAMRTHDAVACTVTDRMDAAVFPGAKAKILANFGVGYSHIDVEAARAAGVMVSNTPGVLTDCTADLAMALILAAMRRLTEGERELREGRWSGWRPTHLIGAKPTGATLGVIGYGRIGRALARRAALGFGMRVVYFNRSPITDDDLGAQPLDSVEAVLAEADIVSLHMPGGAANRHVIDARRLALMKPGAFLINTARGEVVDEAALAAALTAGRLGGVGLDVFEDEPAIHPDLLAAPNAVLAPHLGSATQATREAMGMMALDNIAAALEGREPPNRVA